MKRYSGGKPEPAEPENRLDAPDQVQDGPAAKPDEKRVKAELALLEGKWRPIRVRGFTGLGEPDLGDGDLSAEEARRVGLGGWEFKEGIASIDLKGKTWGPPFIVVLKPDANPKTMDLVGASGRAKGRKLLALYAIEGDRLQIRYRSVVRPETLGDPLGTRDVDWILEREKD